MVFLVYYNKFNRQKFDTSLHCPKVIKFSSYNLIFGSVGCENSKYTCMMHVYIGQSTKSLLYRVVILCPLSVAFFFLREYLKRIVEVFFVKTCQNCRSTQKAGPNTEIYGSRSEYGFFIIIIIINTLFKTRRNHQYL